MTHYVIDGGLFDRACGDLMTREFRLSWFDRFPPVAPDALGGENLPGLGGLAELPPAEPVNRSHRIKYRCPRCAAQVWGKPGLRVLCGGEGCDGAAFEAV